MREAPEAGGPPLALSDFDFLLPEERIALHPASPRDSSRLLVVRGGTLEDRIFTDLPSLLAPGDCLVFNDTRVISARLLGTRIRGENALAFEALLLKRLESNLWRAFAKPGKRLKLGDHLRFGGEGRACAAGVLAGEIIAKHEDGSVDIAFDRDDVFLDEAIELIGGMPLPPYILDARKKAGEGAQDSDRSDYQTLFAKTSGAIAAPTASLHFTPNILESLEKRSVTTARVTLHVGAGTFLPVKDENLDNHVMHAEWGEVPAETAARLNAVRAAGGRIIAAGTTVARLLESAADTAGWVHPFMDETAIFIRPGYRFRAVDALITNFHLPKSTLLMLVSAFAGYQTMRAAYAHAIAAGYRFYSYGDASLLFPDQS